MFFHTEVDGSSADSILKSALCVRLAMYTFEIAGTPLPTTQAEQAAYWASKLDAVKSRDEAFFNARVDAFSEWYSISG